MSESNRRIYLSSPHMSGDEQVFIQQAFEQNWIAPLGPNVDAFETTVAEYCGVKYAAALSSGTAAIHLALIMLGIRSGDEVIVSTFTFSATVNPIVYQGASPIFVDSEADTWNMDPELLETVLIQKSQNGTLNKVKAIIVVHLYGMPAKMDEIMAIANKYAIPVIEDAAEALGSTYRSKPLGSFGKMAVLSFNGNKIITTSGGGALLSNDDKYIQKARFLATQARDPAPHYQHSEIGYNYRMSNVLAGIGRGQMKVINERISKRIDNFNYYKLELSCIDSISFLDLPGNDFFSNRWLTTFKINAHKSKVTYSDIQKTLEKQNIESRPLWKPMHLQPVFQGYESFVNGTSESLFNCGLCIPSGSNLSETDRSLVVKIIKSCFN